MSTYTTTQGDMWDSIAFQQMGSVDYTDQLMNANQQYREYYTFPAGIALTIPRPAAPRRRSSLAAPTSRRPFAHTFCR